jgi:hypothetical protein
MSEFTAVGRIDSGVVVEPKVGDVWILRDSPARATVGGTAIVAVAWICDTVPFEAGPVTRVCVEKSGESREWMTVEELRRRFVFRRRA